MATNKQIAAMIQPGESVSKFFDRINDEGPRCCQWCDLRTMNDHRPPTPGRVRHAAQRILLTGYSGSLVAALILGDGVQGRDPQTAREVDRSMHSVIAHR